MTSGRLLRALFPALSLWLGVGCGGQSTVVSPVAPRVESHTVTASVPADVSIELRSPAQVRWLQTTLGPTKPTLGVVVANRGASPLDVSDLRVHVEAVLDDVSFRCADEVGPTTNPREHEPRNLPPGGSFVFKRTLDCALPLVGNYAIRVAVAFGRGGTATVREVRSFGLRVFAAKEIEPRNIEPIPALWGALGATPIEEGRPGAAGRLVVALVNGGRTPLELPRFRLAVRVYRLGAPLPCEDAPLELKTPAVLGAGKSYHEPIEVSCLGLGVAGKYEVVGRVRVGERDGDGPWETELGRLRVEISDDPSRIVPVLGHAP
jgi:hypothetical protein